MNEQEMNEQEFYRWIGKRIRDLREKVGMKKKDLAEKIGTSPAFLSNVENDGKKISAYQINRILKILGFTQADLIDDEGKKKLSLTLNGDMLTKLTNGEKRDFLEKIKLVFKLIFSDKLLGDLAEELEAEAVARRAERQLERDAAKEEQAEPDHGDCLNHG